MEEEDQPPAVVLKKISKSFRQGTSSLKVLDEIDLQVKRGELLMLVGPSGSGKTTLISIIAGILSYDEGECLIFGHCFHELLESKKNQFRGHYLGYVFQAFNLIPMLTAEENVSIPLLLNGMKRKEALVLARKRLEQFGLKDRAQTCPSQLSGGEQQRVALARAVVHSPPLIVCDEPTSALDHENGKSVLTYLREIVTQENRTLIVVTHDIRIFSFADRIVHLEDGRIKAISSSAL